MEQKFWYYADITEQCWEWLGPRNEVGYGLLYLGGTAEYMRAHRYSYELLVGSIPDGLVIDHLCRNKSCVRPDHLEPVTIAENSKRGVVYEIKLAKTHCPRDHEYTEENTKIIATKTGPGRVCRICDRMNKAKYRKKMKENR